VAYIKDLPCSWSHFEISLAALSFLLPLKSLPLDYMPVSLLKTVVDTIHVGLAPLYRHSLSICHFSRAYATMLSRSVVCRL